MPAAVRFVGLTCHYGLRPVLSDLDLDIRAGQVTAVMAPNGVGKSTLLNAAAGLVPSWRGFVEIEGHRRRDTEESELACRRASVHLAANPWLPQQLTPREWIVTCGRLWEVDDRRLLPHTASLLDLFDLDDGEKSIRSCSTGQKHKVALAGALVTETPILLLDEPFGGGLDPSGILVLKRLLADAAHAKGRCVLLASPVPETLEDLADRVVVLAKGTDDAAEIVGDGTPAQLREQTESTSLAEAYEALVRPDTAAKLDAYLEATP